MGIFRLNLTGRGIFRDPGAVRGQRGKVEAAEELHVELAFVPASY